MNTEKQKKRFAIIGSGPSGLFMYKRLTEANIPDIEITLFEKKEQLGAGMPYSSYGANVEHVTNVSDNEIPEIVSSMNEWINTASSEILKPFNIAPANFNEYKVVPRLLFGQYLSGQFDLLQQTAKKNGITTEVHINTIVTDVIDLPDEKKVIVVSDNDVPGKFDYVIICTGHYWPRKFEGTVPNYFDSPYPPHKLELKLNHPVAIKGSSLTAIDAIRTLSRNNGSFVQNDDGTLTYTLNKNSESFKLVMHTRNGLLPAIRFHLEDSHLSKDSVLTEEEIIKNKAANDGFVALDFLFEKNFKAAFREQDPDFYEKIKDMRIEEFVDNMMSLRERIDPFVLFKAEYAEAGKSIKRKESVYWKEMLAVLSFAMNYPAKHLSAEDMLRLQKVLMPLISIVIAFVPQSSSKELLALYDAGVLDLVTVGEESEVIPHDEGGAIYNYTDDNGEPQSNHYKFFVDCVGQPHLSYHDFPFKTLVEKKTVSPARLKFRSAEEGKKMIEEGNKQVEAYTNGDYYLQVPGITINDNFQVLDQYGAYNERIYIMAVPYIAGYNPDYSGLDFCEAASALIIKSVVEKHKA